MIRVLVTGGRNYDDQRSVDAALYRVLDQYGAVHVIHGGAGGADACANAWAMAARVGGAAVTVEKFPAEWRRLGKAAGPARNSQMLREGRPDFVIAFPGGAGTADMVAKALAAGLRVVEGASGAVSRAVTP